MRHVFLLAALATLLGALATEGAARADRRAFTETYEYMTIPQGDVELEVWNTQSRSDFGDDGISAFDLQLEIEYGITSHWDIALYQIVAQADGPTPDTSEALHFEETKVETRYRLAERGELPVDTTLYLEVAKGFGETRWEIEPKIILARDFGRANVALNIIPEIAFEEEAPAMPGAESEVEAEFEPGWAAGVSYELVPALKLGAETFGSVEGLGGDNELLWWVGPSAGWAPSPKLWAAATAAVGLTEAAENFRMRIILGINI